MSSAPRLWDVMGDVSPLGLGAISEYGSVLDRMVSVDKAMRLCFKLK